MITYFRDDTKPLNGLPPQQLLNQVLEVILALAITRELNLPSLHRHHFGLGIFVSLVWCGL